MNFGRITSPATQWPELFLQGTKIPYVATATDLGVTIDSTLRFHAHIRNVVGRSAALASNLARSTCNREPEFMRTLFITHVRPSLEYCATVWNTGYICDYKLLESVQRRWTKLVRGLDELSYLQRLKSLNLFSVQGRLLRNDLIKVWKIFSNNSVIKPEDLFVMAPYPSTRGHPLKIAHVRYRLACRERFFAVRVIGRWNSLPGDIVLAGTVETFKAKLMSFLGDALFEYVD